MDNKIKDIRELLVRFYDATATPAEEEQLADFFDNAKNLPEDLEADRRVFRSLHEVSGDFRMPDSLGRNILEAVENRASADKTSGTEKALAAARSAFAGKSRGKLRRWLIPAISAAAVAAVLLMIPFGKESSATPDIAGELASARVLPTDTAPESKLTKESSSVPEADRTPALQPSATKSTASVSRKPTAVTENSPATGEVTLSQEEKDAMMLALATLSKAGKEMAEVNEKLESTETTLQNTFSKISNIKI